jgi:hypothetical protein
MLDFSSFCQIIADLETFYGKKLNEFALKVYYKNILKAGLDETGLKVAIEYAISNHDFFPNPTKLLGTKRFLEVHALEEYQIILDIIAGLLAEKELENLSPHTFKVLKTLGGLNSLKNELNDKLYGSLQQQFVHRWITYRDAISFGEIKLPPKALPEAPQEKPKEEDYMPREDVGKMMRELKDIIKNKKNNSNDPENS